jgi:hypothetical protein
VPVPESGSSAPSESTGGGTPSSGGTEAPAE